MAQGTVDAAPLARILAKALGSARAHELLDMLVVDPALLAPAPAGQPVPRGVVAAALGAALFADLLDRVPTGRSYVVDVIASGGKIAFDHGALRTVRMPSGPTGAQPPGKEAFARLLEPLGYAVEGVYPLDRLKMTGFAFTHQDFPETLPQYFVSELHVDRFSPAFVAAAGRVFGTTRESIGAAGAKLLAQLKERGAADEAAAAAGLPDLVAAFGRWHDIPREADYETLLKESAEAAWIATEGSAFNHATDRVPDVTALADAQRALGRPIKDAVEISSTGRVRQTAFKADPVLRTFLRADGSKVERRVPGSFYEFITRDPLPAPEEGRRLDLRFDSSNAQGIFRMTAAGKGGA
jgi:hypothetical protein